jgi:uncharacterized protein (TIGR00255 family)
MQSMTGYGRSDVYDDRLALTIEAKSVNHRYLDIAWHYPRVYAPLEARMKQLVSRHFARGRIDIRITSGENGHAARTVTPDYALAQQYYEALRELQYRLGVPGTVDMRLLMGLRDVLKVSENVPADVEADWPLIADGLTATLGALKAMRLQEGAFLCEDLGSRMQVVAQQAALIRERLPQVVTDYQQRLEQRVKEWFERVDLDAARLSQEAVVLAERGDITEELTRLEAHLQAMQTLLASTEAVGRKVDFLVQEMRREIETIAAKANDLTISHCAVEIKSELERCREQIQNIE